VEQHRALAVKLVRDRRYRAVATCNVCNAVLSQGPEASYPGLAAFALGLSMAHELGGVSADLITRFHLGPGCPGGSIRLTIEELRPAPPAAGASS
jgi:hypothetical protein